MYICRQCGHTFDADEAATVTERHPYGDTTVGESLSVCPICGGDFEEAHACKECGREFLKDELYSGYCVECLKKAITYDTTLQFLEDSDLLPHFMFDAVYDSQVPEYVSPMLNDTLRELFLRRKNDDLLCEKKEFLELCKKYILEDDASFGKCYFAEWLEDHKKEVKK